MLLRTHLAGALAAALYLVKLRPELDAVFLASAFFASLLPDIDSRESSIGRELPWLSWIVKLLFGHRTLFHAVWIPLALVALSLLKPVVAYGIAVGYLSHIFLDMLTVQGVQPLYPLPPRIRGFIRTGGFAEGIVFICLVMVCGMLVMPYFF